MFIIQAINNKHVGDMPFGGTQYINSFLHFVQPNHRSRITELQPRQRCKANFNLTSSGESASIECEVFRVK